MTDFEDRVTEIVTDIMGVIPEQFHEPTHLTNPKLPMLANSLSELAAEFGAEVGKRTPKITDIWRQGHPSTYEIIVRFPDCPAMEIPVILEPLK